MNSDELIRRLCNRVIDAEGDEVESAAADLHIALKIHMQALRAMAAAAFLGSSAYQHRPSRN